MALHHFSDFSIEIGKPTVVYQAPRQITGWDYYNFPKIRRVAGGDKLYVNWSLVADTTYISDRLEGTVEDAVSDDGGKTWRRRKEGEYPADFLMPNGCYFCGFDIKSAYTADELENYPMAAKGASSGVFAAERLPKRYHPHCTATEYDPKTGELRRFDVMLNWRYVPLKFRFGELQHNALLPIEYMIALDYPMGMVSKDGVLYYAIYARGLNSDAPTLEEAAADYREGEDRIYILKSEDSGRTWDYVSNLAADDHILRKKGCEGFCEPTMTVMPDGSFLMVMRMGTSAEPWIPPTPCYYTRSTDNGRTWSYPKVFDQMGVYPQLLTLGCGVTLSTYGRPKYHLRATADPSGKTWEAPVRIQLTDHAIEDHWSDHPMVIPDPNPTEDEKWNSCYYSGLVPLDDHTALMVYSDFQYPKPDGSGPCRAVVVRTITVLQEAN